MKLGLKKERKYLPRTEIILLPRGGVNTAAKQGREEEAVKV